MNDPQDAFVARRGYTRADRDAARAMHARAFPKFVEFPADDLLWLLERTPRYGGGIAGYGCAAFRRPLGVPVAALTMSAVDAWGGQGGQRVLLAAREKWAVERGCELIWTHCATDNYRSLANLMKAGYIAYGWDHRRQFHQFFKQLTKDAPYPAHHPKLARALWRLEVTK